MPPLVECVPNFSEGRDRAAAAGYPGVDSVVDGWMRSDGHCANIMNPSFDEMGLACVIGAAGSRYGQYWTQNLARKR